jgi:hypothetical protein
MLLCAVYLSRATYFQIIRLIDVTVLMPGSEVQLMSSLAAGGALVLTQRGQSGFYSCT